MATDAQTKTSWLWATTVAVMLLIMEFVLLSALIPADWSTRMRDQEVHWVSSQLGDETATAVFAAAQRGYGTVFLRSGLVDASYALLLPDAAVVNETPELDKLAAVPIWPWVKTRLDLIWFAIYLAIQRLVVLFAWWPFIGFAILSAVADGLIRRRIRLAGFDYPSPLAHRLAVRILIGLAFLVGFGLLLPLPVPPLAVPVLALMSAGALSVLLTQTQKRI
ncbi:hypothetical protein CKO42_24040 [Lamprobacter modestohalophilus]|uniref:DUF4400 domain-containing protein n=1 Tax=Lamprobacter modestohalophilus TaxID=1064514 RepID=A0A9X0WDJ1_9GAMM|nr:DUF4400 domain-containing protein [Lamprobacter modestohalophilus]MBK1621427.1 hypothetical protein [Lamprobacter modestohalophilus]